MKQDTRQKTLIFLFCWVSYTISYLSRTNLSAVLDQMMQGLSLSRAAAGSIGSLYFWAYACGQLINGQLAGRLNPKRMIIAGHTLSLLCNAGIGFSRSYGLILLLWGLNGFALSMIWTPTFKIITNWYPPQEYQRVSVYISLPTTVGYLISWGILRTATAYVPWQFAFFIPAGVALVFLPLWIRFVQPQPPGPHPVQGRGVAPAAPAPSLSLGRLVLRYGLLFVGAAALVQGLIKESINLWGPTLLQEVGSGFSTSFVSALSIFIPASGTVGVFLVLPLIRLYKQSGYRILRFLFVGLALLLAGAFVLQQHFLGIVLLLGLIMALVCGANVVITSFIPTRYVRYNLGPQLAGLLNFLVYIGAALGGLSSGLLSGSWGWNGLYVFWAALCLAAALCATLWHRFFPETQT